MFHFIRKILKENLSSIDMDKYPNSTVMSFTDDGSMYVNRNDGSQQKITDVLIFNSRLQLEELGNYNYDKLYVLNADNEKAIMLKTKNGLVDIFSDIKDNTSTIDENVKSINDTIVKIDETITDLQNKIKTNASYILNNVNAINELKKENSKKEFKIIIPISNLKVGILEPIIPISSFIFNENQEITLESITYNNLAGVMLPDSKLQLSISLFDKVNNLVKKIVDIQDPKNITEEISVIDENKLKVKDGFYRLNIENIENLDSQTYKGTLVLKLIRNESFVPLEVPPIIPEK